MSEHDPASIENVDDRGGYPSEGQLKEAFEGLGYQRSTN